MRCVVLDSMKPPADAPGRNLERRRKIVADSSEARHHACTVKGKTRHANRVTESCTPARARIAWNRNVIHFGKFHSRLIEAIPDGAHRQSRRVLHAIQPLLFDSGPQTAVRDNRRRSVRVLRVNSENDHFAFVSCFYAASQSWGILSSDRSRSRFPPLEMLRCRNAQIPLRPFIQNVETPRPRPSGAPTDKFLPHN